MNVVRQYSLDFFGSRVPEGEGSYVENTVSPGSVLVLGSGEMRAASEE